MGDDHRRVAWLDPDGKTLRIGRPSKKDTSDAAAVGECYHEVDGYLVWVPPERQGCWDAPALRIVADFLDEANREWDDSIREYFEKEAASGSSPSES